MCRSMVDIQSPTAEIRRGKKKKIEEEDRKKLQGKNIMAPLLHRAAITISELILAEVQTLECPAAMSRDRQTQKQLSQPLHQSDMTTCSVARWSIVETSLSLKCSALTWN